MAGLGGAELPFRFAESAGFDGPSVPMDRVFVDVMGPVAEAIGGWR